MTNLRDIDLKDSSKFRLIGRSVLSYRFIAPHDTTLYIGDIKKITDRIKKTTFFAKITDLSHDSNFADSRWDTRVYAEQFYGVGEDVFFTVDAMVDDVISGGVANSLYGDFARDASAITNSTMYLYVKPVDIGTPASFKITMSMPVSVVPGQKLWPRLTTNNGNASYHLTAGSRMSWVVLKS